MMELSSQPNPAAFAESVRALEHQVAFLGPGRALTVNVVGRLPTIYLNLKLHKVEGTLVRSFGGSPGA
jgi:hypothetical protein